LSGFLARFAFVERIVQISELIVWIIEYRFIGVSTSSEKRSPVRAKVREAVSEAILEAAEAVALENGIEAATAAAIAARAGVAVGTLYNYFPDRDGILSALFKARRAEILPAIEAGATAAAPLAFAERLRAYVRSLLEVFDDHSNFVKLAVTADAEGAKIRGRDKTLMTQVLHQIEQIMKDGAARKLFPASRVTPYTRMLQGALKGLMHWRVDESGSLASDADLVVDVFLRGVTS
jgi:AcrR family transcriptional regulator